MECKQNDLSLKKNENVPFASWASEFLSKASLSRKCVGVAKASLKRAKVIGKRPETE
jgi:hypothetical protein